VRIRILYFASLREQLGRGTEELDVPGDVTTLGELRAHLATRGSVWAAALAGNRSIRMARNQDMAAPESPISAGDEVAFFPPVTGG